MLQDATYIYTWDAQNRLTQVKLVSTGAVVASYAYDSDGMRRTSTVGSTTTRYAVDELTDEIVATLDSAGAVVTSFVRDAAGRLIGMVRGGSVYTYLSNAHGDVTALVDAAGAVVARWTYDAWGKPTEYNAAGSQVALGTSGNPFLFAGYFFDVATGLYYLRARYYDPRTGRFLSMDPEPGKVTDRLSQNPYIYCQNDPVNLSDPTGRAVVQGTGVGPRLTAWQQIQLAALRAKKAAEAARKAAAAKLAAAKKAAAAKLAAAKGAAKAVGNKIKSAATDFVKKTGAAVVDGVNKAGAALARSAAKVEETAKRVWDTGKEKVRGFATDVGGAFEPHKTIASFDSPGTPITDPAAQLQEGDVVVYQSQFPLFFVSPLSGGGFNGAGHVAVYIGDGMVKEYNMPPFGQGSTGRVPNGSNVRPLYDGKDRDFIVVRHEDYDPVQGARYLSTEGPYSFGELVPGWTDGNSRSNICSQFAAMVWRTGGATFREDDNWITPNDFLRENPGVVYVGTGNQSHDYDY